MNHKIREYRDILKKGVDSKVGKAIREELNSISNRYYFPHHSYQEYMKWIAEHLPTFKRVGYQDKNFPFYMQMFTIKSQFIYGDSIYECLDQAMED